MTISQPGPGSRPAVKRSQALDLIRAVSILWVVGLWHVLDYLPELPDTKNAVTYRVTVAMLGSFVLVSGYLMGRKDIPLTRAGLTDFYVGRFGRIYPPFLAACAVFLVMKMGDPLALAKAALLLAMLWGPPPFTLWFIAMIVLFYAATPLLSALRTRAIGYALAVAGVTAVLVVAQGMGSAVSPRLAMYFPIYAAGLWLGRATPSWRSVALTGLILALLGFAGSAMAPAAAIENSVWLIGWALSIPLLAVGSIMAIDSRIPRVYLVTLIAEASYFLYLFHRAAYAVVLKIWHPAEPGVRAALLILFALPVALALALIGQRLYDRAWLWLRPGRADRP